MSLPALTAACVFLELDRRYGTHFFDTARGGNPLMWQQLFLVFWTPLGLRDLPAGHWHGLS